MSSNAQLSHGHTVASPLAAVELPEGKTAFRDPKDLLAKTHDIRANAASARIRLADAVTPVRATDPRGKGDDEAFERRCAT